VGKTTIKKRGIADVVIPRARKDEVLRDELLGAVSVLRDMGIEQCAHNFSCRHAVGHDLENSDPPELTPTWPLDRPNVDSARRNWALRVF
jgi:hypothetical protein